ncbi:hypothetical protein BOX15_Mlig032001g1 [Macrostomum lignano]|uniref:Thioredoxin domain-containing protein n=2 Tax=Macrostomum lignano TaxID=282301 RepID=A0A267F114_9PLAT|nr:hypothetical protein BOX15_Mlig032001g1 [Macrostomum lignano]
MLLLLPLLAGLLSPISPAEAKRVLDITEKNLASVVGTKTLALVLFYSPGCQPCVEVLSVMQRLALSHSVSHPDVKFGRIDIRQEPVLAMRFHADEVPVLKAFPHSSTPITFYGEVTEEALVKFLRGLRLQSAVKAGLTRSGESLYGGASLETATDDGGAADEGDSANPWTTGATVVVNASSYASVILDNETNAMLALYTPECGEPCAVYEKIADVFRHEGHHVVFGRADVTREPQLARFFQAQRNPTLLWFPRGDKNNIVRYGGDVDLHEIVGFINDMTGSHRQPDGKLEPGAGRVAQIERLLRDRAADLVLGRNLQQLSEEVAQAASDLPHSKRYVFYYQRLLRQLMKGSPIDRVLERENAAIDQLLNGGSGGGIGGGSKMSRAERDEAHKLHNIISGVVDIIVDHLQGERQSAEAAAVAEKRRLMEEQQKRLHEEGESAGDEEEFTEQAEAVKATKEEL